MTDGSMSSGSRWYAHGTPAKDSLHIAAHVYGAIPSGWLALWRQTVRQLVNARTPEREFALMYLSVDWDNGLLELDMPWADEVLTGIARRCAQRSRFICRHCGKPGLLRRFDMSDVAVLCARCAAPELLHRAIDDTVKYPGLIAIGGRADDVRRVCEASPGAGAGGRYAVGYPERRRLRATIRRWVKALGEDAKEIEDA